MVSGGQCVRLPLVFAIANQPPVCNISTSSLTIPVGGSVNVDASGSFDPDPLDTITSYQWDCHYNGSFNAEALGVSATCGSYNSSGFYTIALRLNDNQGNQSDPNASVCQKQVNVQSTTLGVDLTPNTQAGTIDLSVTNSINYTVSVKNTGSVPDSYNLSILPSPLPGCITGAMLSQNSVGPLNAGASTNVTLTVTANSTNNSCVNTTQTVSVKGTSQANPSVTDTATTNTSIIRTTNLGVDLTPSVQFGEINFLAEHNSFTYTITVKNIGSVTDTYNLSVLPSPLPSCVTSAVLSQSVVTLAASASTNVTLTITVDTSNSACVNTTQIIDVKATSQTDSLIMDIAETDTDCINCRGIKKMGMQTVFMDGPSFLPNSFKIRASSFKYQKNKGIITQTIGTNTLNCTYDGNTNLSCTGYNPAGPGVYFDDSSDGIAEIPPILDGVKIAGPSKDLVVEYITDAAARTDGVLPGETIFRVELILDGTFLRERQVHTSCSQPIFAGDVFGDFRVTYIEKLLAP